VAKSTQGLQGPSPATGQDANLPWLDTLAAPTPPSLSRFQGLSTPQQD
jgi:ABC-type xylose transport system substrate-binding protein